MTRTNRATSPAALRKDRSVNKTGLDGGVRKHGAGPHNWGSLDHEAEYESGGAFDADADAPGVDEYAGDTPSATEHIDVSPTEMDEARKLRKEAGKGGNVDLGEIARSSAAVQTSPTNADVQTITNAADVSSDRVSSYA
ncbi:hypothetical protein BD626DRAFT_410777 [Schizophyllum amplum]|uniref:Hyaluronan/mRNA-binding protein domain-containing protein n=1 Tax=Schizophyllum amplum TaxID=97359 RepID=A0A550C0H5_9AGAR|nr:hypothetical protein BD626DRAFT_410777 [Auriculariopsis ampla]